MPQDALIRQVLQGIGFDKSYWKCLVGECLVYGAVDVPRVTVSPHTVCALVAPAPQAAPSLLSPGSEGSPCSPQASLRACGIDATPRPRTSSVRQALFGSRDLAFGPAFYRPDRAGWNDAADCARLLVYLQSIQPDNWRTEDLAALVELVDADERQEELAHARDWWPDFVRLYQTAVEDGLMLVCEWD
ncbi:MAG: hypothetical protein L0215_18045 [Gemmataceae bacterium]|nr:hypothetical protein [Gemmataceae bacterium]